MGGRGGSSGGGGGGVSIGASTGAAAVAEWTSGSERATERQAEFVNSLIKDNDWIGDEKRAFARTGITMPTFEKRDGIEVAYGENGLFGFIRRMSTSPRYAAEFAKRPTVMKDSEARESPAKYRLQAKQEVAQMRWDVAFTKAVFAERAAAYRELARRGGGSLSKSGASKAIDFLKTGTL